jgi:hypothetical protein
MENINNNFNNNTIWNIDVFDILREKLYKVDLCI